MKNFLAELQYKIKLNLTNWEALKKRSTEILNEIVNKEQKKTFSNIDLKYVFDIEIITLIGMFYFVQLCHWILIYWIFEVNVKSGNLFSYSNFSCLKLRTKFICWISKNKLFIPDYITTIPF